ncbi:hypothetical protein [Gordonia crocea]|uniref:Uncharacterized protein n=1 Tax=Gordonia crocea TaxID=589162 RepID=A0A7I9V0T9_9ACTN|nr:hypothetical protein [Gordonia crocea]GED99074.1 hypothetical protein nbrc107697_31130 [Gordonia crocea]
MDEDFAVSEQAAADALDVAIDDALAGDRTDPALAWLSTAFADAPSAAVTERIADRVAGDAAGVSAAPSRRRRMRTGPARVDPARAWRWPRVAAAVLGVLLMLQGLSALVAGEYIAENIGEPFVPHAATEGAFALIAVGFVALIASLDRQWVVLAVAAGVPLGITLGVHGAREVNVWAWGAALHLTEGLAAVVLLVSFLVVWRRGRKRNRSSA